MTMMRTALSRPTRLHQKREIKRQSDAAIKRQALKEPVAVAAPVEAVEVEVQPVKKPEPPVVPKASFTRASRRAVEHEVDDEVDDDAEVDAEVAAPVEASQKQTKQRSVMRSKKDIKHSDARKLNKHVWRHGSERIVDRVSVSALIQAAKIQQREADAFEKAEKAAERAARQRSHDKYDNRRTFKHAMSSIDMDPSSHTKEVHERQSLVDARAKQAREQQNAENNAAAHERRYVPEESILVMCDEQFNMEPTEVVTDRLEYVETDYGYKAINSLFVVHMTDKAVYFGVGKNELLFSISFPSVFDDGKRVFKTVQQALTYYKAELFEQMNDNSWRDSRVGGSVKDVDESAWDLRANSVMFAVNVAKFASEWNMPLLQALLSTGQRTIVHVGPCEKQWGIGMSESAIVKMGEDKKHWKGKNRLGHVLEKVRTLFQLIWSRSGPSDRHQYGDLIETYIVFNTVVHIHNGYTWIKTHRGHWIKFVTPEQEEREGYSTSLAHRVRGYETEAAKQSNL